MWNFIHELEYCCFMVFSCFKQEAGSDCPVHIAAKSQECTADSCGVELRIVQHIFKEGKSLLNTRCLKFLFAG
jgi:hypothetical protein